ncbi:MAG: sulfatase-like hydrolase/transferase [Ilumatobacteraceae bacterium]
MSRPNIVLFMPDQLRADALGCFGSPVASTPNIDALAARGVRFDDAWAQHPVCGPSRVSLLTGWYPHVAGHRTLDNLIDDHEPNLFKILREAGYYVAIAGDRGDVFAPGVTESSSDFCGFLEPPVDAMTRYTSPYPTDHRLHRAMYFGESGDSDTLDFDEATIRTAERWLREGAPTDQPWVLWVPLIFPHPPFTVEEPWFSMHDRSAMPDPIAAADAVGKPGFMDAYRDIYGWGDLSIDDFHEIAATYHGMVSRVDAQLARVLDAVDDIGATDDTVIGFFADHGEYLGDFGLVEKWPSAMDPCILRNPLILAGAGLPAGVVVDRPVELVDLLPTVCELGEAEVKHTHFGRSLLPVMNDPTVAHREFACSEGGFRVTDQPRFERAKGIYEPKSRLQRERPELVGTAIALRTPTHTYVHRRYESDEFYDRLADPNEMINLIGRPEDLALQADLRDELLGWIADTSDVIPWEPNPRRPAIVHGFRGDDPVRPTD